MVTLYQLKKLYDDYDSDSGITEDEYIDLVDDVISYDLQLRVRRLAEQNYSMISKLIEIGKYSNKKEKRKLLQLQSISASKLDSEKPTGYTENMLNSSLARLAQYRKSRSTELLSKFDEAFVEVFLELSSIDELEFM